MAPNLTNLLPSERARAFRQTYFLRLATVAALALAVLIAAHAALLSPAYLFVSERAALAKEELSALSASLATSEEAEMNARLARLSDDVARLREYASAPASSDVLRSVLEVPRSGITLAGLAVTPGKGGANGRMVISGNAATRESLRQYHAALSKLPGVTGVDLPLSAYAKESDITFTLTLTGPLTP